MRRKTRLQSGTRQTGIMPNSHVIYRLFGMVGIMFGQYLIADIYTQREEPFYSLQFQLCHDRGYLVTQDELDQTLDRFKQQFGDKPRYAFVLYCMSVRQIWCNSGVRIKGRFQLRNWSRDRIGIMMSGIGSVHMESESCIYGISIRCMIPSLSIYVESYLYSCIRTIDAGVNG